MRRPRTLSHEPLWRAARGAIACAWVTAPLATLCGCDPEAVSLPPPGHVLLHVDTDAPVPPSPGVAVDAKAPPPLFDRLLVEVIAPGQTNPCDDCTRELELTEEVLRAGGSLTIEPTGDRSGIRVRLRMFRAAGRLEGAPPPEATVETTVLLPETPDEGALEAWVLLPVEAVGAPIGTLEAPAAVETTAPAGSRVGTWAGARRIDCAQPPGPGEVCVPGGAFWMGSPLSNDEPKLDASQQRLVVLSPFYLDAREATVQSYRAASVPPGGVVFWSGDSDGDDYEDFCTYPAAPDPAREGLPVSCINWSGARAYCQQRGADLPTEAQLEYVLGGLASLPYVWGFDLPRCADAVWSRAQDRIENFGGFLCAQDLAPGDIGGAQPLPEDAVAGELGPPRLRDWLVLETGTLFDLAGNLNEWARDQHNRQDEPCWARPGTNVFVDPLCETLGVDGDLRAVRGGSWGNDASSLRASHRRASAPEMGELGGTVRCARAATAAAVD
jgi:formylglycine-generating enzyme required for sulfatase activity